MNTKSAVRTALAAVAAGALVLGSAGATTAAPKAKKSGKQEYMQLRMVDVHNGFLNVNPDAKHRDIKVKALVRDTVKGSDPEAVTVTLTHYAAKGTPFVDPVTPPYTQDVPLELKSKAGKKSQKYRGVVEGDVLAAALASAVPEGITAYICLADASLTAGDGVKVKDWSKQVQKKIDRGRDCFRVINVKPDTTTSTSDDPS